MLSIDFDFSIPGYSRRDIGDLTLVRDKRTDIQFEITNDSNNSISNLEVAITVESYIGQAKPILFRHYDPQIVERIPRKSMVPLKIRIYPSFPGLVAVSIQVTNPHGNDVNIKKLHGKSYQPKPVRWWFHVADDIAVETLRTLKKLLKQK